MYIKSSVEERKLRDASIGNAVLKPILSLQINVGNQNKMTKHKRR
jgi:hypothetical protein